MAKSFYKAVGGITDGMAFHGAGEVFVGSEALDSHFEDYEGKNGDVVLYEKADKAAYDKYVAEIDHRLVDGTPRGVVGFEPSGEDSIVSTQRVAGSEDLLEADPETGKPGEGDPIALDSAEAERRATANPDGTEGGSGVAPSAEKADKAPKVDKVDKAEKPVVARGDAPSV